MHDGRWFPAVARSRWDRVGPAFIAVVMALTALLWAGPAFAQAEDSYDSVEECIEARPIEIDPMAWSCFSVDGETWVARQQGTPAERAFGGFVVLALLWSGVPLVIAAMLASSRGESIGMAIVLTLFLGWIGLAIVYFGQRKSRDAVEGLMDRASEPERTRSRSTTEAAPLSPQISRVSEDAPAAVRLRELARLHRDELISDDEYQQQRQRILEQI